MNISQILKLPHKVRIALSFLILFFASTSEAVSFRKDLAYSISGGLGDYTINKDVFIQDTVQKATRSESPGVLQLSVELNLNDKMSLALRHSRGFRIGPFSTGVSFTGLVYRYYFGRKPYLSSPEESNSVTFMNWALFVGGGAGYANANTSREREILKDISSSGMYFGFHVGADYHMYSNFIFRPEIVYSTTLFDDTEQPAKISEMALILGIVFKL